MIVEHKIETIRFSDNNLILGLRGRELIVPLAKLSKKLEAATDMQRQFFKISHSGYGIHWPLLDEDLSVAGILREFT